MVFGGLLWQVNSLDKLGMDTSELRAGLELAKAQRKILLEEFAS